MSKTRLLLLLVSIVITTSSGMTSANDFDSVINDRRKAIEQNFHKMMEEVEAMDHSTPQYLEKKRSLESLGRMMGFRAKGDTSNRVPEAYASYSKSVLTDSLVKVSGFASHDWDDDPLSFRWSFTQKPDRSRAKFLDATIMAPTFIPDVPGSYEVQLVVSDGKADSQPHSIIIIATQGHDGLPADPGEAGKQTLAGIDTDNDGIRDDIQRHIYATYPARNQKSIRFFLGEIAYNLTNAIQDATDPELAYAYNHRHNQYLHCLDLEAGDESEKMDLVLNAELLDTKDRLMAWTGYQRKIYGYEYNLELKRINDDFCQKVQNGSALPDIATVVEDGRARWDAMHTPSLHVLEGHTNMPLAIIPPKPLHKNRINTHPRRF